jgi:prepilin-type N-terminal cleavage/methylation domain-containing protein/prepilin-type processing-associated H-X9-DG protein
MQLRIPKSRHGFTLVELLVVIATVAILAATLVSALGMTNPRSKGLLCLDNKRQLILAWQMYATDNSGKIVQNFHGAAAANANNAPWVLGWLTWDASPDNTNTLLISDDRFAKLARYASQPRKIYKCPSDTYLSSVQISRAWTERVRSVSSNIGIGGGNAESGPWEPIYKHIITTADFLYPGPSETWVYADEHPDSINDPGLFNPRRTSWIDTPAMYHEGGASFAFADGHTEIHKWRGSLAAARAQRVKLVNAIDAPVTGEDPDIQWMSYRAGRVSESSY